MMLHRLILADQAQEDLVDKKHRPPGKALRQSLQHLPLLRASQNKLAGHGSVAVNSPLDRRHQFGRVLDFIKNQRGGMIAQKKIRIPPGPFQVNAWIKYHIVVSGKQVLKQGGLTNLPGAAEYGHRKMLHHAEQSPGKEAVFIHALQIKHVKFNL